MDLAAVFAGLDGVAWPELHHAYGPADDVPGLLRALTAADQAAVAEADQDLWSSLVHQGTVYEATVSAVPFLARLAAAGVRRADLLGMLGAIAESTDDHGLDRPGAARAAVVAQLPLMLPLLSDATLEVRQCAAWAVAQCGQAAGPAAQRALRQRWEAEADPAVRADVLTACVLVDRDAADELCAAALRPTEPAPVRVAALLACVDTGRPWDRELAAVVAGLSPLGQYAAGSQWEREPLKALAMGLYDRGDVDAAIEVVVSALDRAVETVRVGADPRPAVAEATWAAESLALRSRTAPVRLLPAMLPLLDTPATAGDVITAVRDWAESAPRAVPALVRLAEGTSELADRALAALVSLGAPEAADLLAQQLADRPHALEAAFQRTMYRPPAPLPCTPALLGTVRARLAAVTADAAAPRKRQPLPAGGLAAVNEPVFLAGLLAGWGPSARAAIPELVDALPHHSVAVGRALAAVADAEPDPEAVTALRACAGAGPRPQRQAAAAALHALTGDARPLVAVLGSALSEQNTARDQCVQAAASLGEQARPLLPHLLALLAEPAETRTDTAAVRAGLAAAAAVWKLTGDQESVLPMVLEGLTWAARPWGHQAANRGAEVAALLGPAAQPTVPHLLPMLDRPDTAAAAVRALVAAHPGSDRPAGVTLTDLVDRVLPSAAPGAYLNSALAALEALAALGPAAFTPAQLGRVQMLADGERRVVGSGSHTEIIHDDMEFRAVARRVLADLADLADPAD
ncbi:hypothetical protein [Streptomyces sp. HUAS TT20]|uniref:hypothetical protein n=1 Tax=Streptomyces sp. HUAS TT20 TaxID=3447509 RepID=UPI0021D92B72|nr:hypothetical protein [Streptomyces sp. HUAS 15-9]UXY26089.1 hypothetical protein N8I87_05550 [Streptomyces sp. HUAS 15-9]